MNTTATEGVCGHGTPLGGHRESWRSPRCLPATCRQAPKTFEHVPVPQLSPTPRLGVRITAEVLLGLARGQLHALQQFQNTYYRQATPRSLLLQDGCSLLHFDARTIACSANTGAQQTQQSLLRAVQRYGIHLRIQK